MLKILEEARNIEQPVRKKRILNMFMIALVVSRRKEATAMEMIRKKECPAFRRGQHVCGPDIEVFNVLG